MIRPAGLEQLATFRACTLPNQATETLWRYVSRRLAFEAATFSGFLSFHSR
jgi:hypothetical protein